MEKTERYAFCVEPFHVDFSGHLFLGVLGNHLLNAAGRHSHNRGWGIDHLNQVHYTWVLSRLTIELSEMPAQYEHVEVETWVESVLKLFTERNFAIRNADDGRIYGYARSIWAMIDTTSRKPANLLTLHDGDILRYVIPADEKPCPINRHSTIRVNAGQPLRRVPTYYSDVDINGHINSIKYIEHILDLYGREQFEQRRLQRFEIAYKTEAHMGDELALFCDGFTLAPPAETPLAATLLADAEQTVEIRKQLGSQAHPDGVTVAQARLLWRDCHAV